MRSQYAYTEVKASIPHVAGLYPRNSSPRPPPPPILPPIPPGGRFRWCYASPCTEGVAAARHQLLSDCTHPAFPPPGEPRDSGFRTSLRPFPRKLSADVRARDGKTEVVAGSLRRSVFRRTPPLSRSEEGRRKKINPQTFLHMSRRSPLLFAQGPRLPSDVSFCCIRRSGKKLLLRLDNAGRRDVFKSVSRVGEVIQISRGRGRVFVSCFYGCRK